MATAQASALVSFVLNAKQNGWGYVFGAQGQLYTKALAEEWARKKKSGRDYNYFVVRCARWFGRTVVDCSGLLIEAFRSQIPGYGDKSANTLFARCVQTGMLKTIPEIPGLCVWRSGHIGMYIGKGKVVEAGGTNVGVVISDLNAPATSKRWTNWGKLADVNYTEMPKPPVENAPEFWLGRYLKMTAPSYMQGEDVADVQQALARQGYSPGTIDGFYGTKTQKAVQAFQKSRGLSADGVVGPDTTAALNGVWLTDAAGGCPNCENPLGSFAVKRLLKLDSPYMRGEDVRDVQEALQIFSFSSGESDGIFGPKTQGAVEAFQKSRRLKADGIVGPDTVRELGGQWTGK